MPITGNILERVKIIHETLQAGGMYSSAELLEILGKKLGTDALGLNRRTLIDDIEYLRQNNAPIPDRKRKYYYEAGAKYSLLNTLGISDENKFEELKGIVQSLMHMDKISDLVTALDKTELKFLDKGEKFVSFDKPIEISNRKELPNIINYIKNKQIIDIKYSEFDGSKWGDRFHPYLLKEYNGKWYLFGYSEKWVKEKGIDKNKIFNYAVDRIDSINLTSKKGIEFIENTWWEPKSHFEQILGVTKYTENPVEKVVLRVYGEIKYFLYNNRLHQSQDIFDEQDEYDDFIFKISLNHEFKNQILAYGHNAEVLYPPHLRLEIKDRVAQMASYYENQAVFNEDRLLDF